MIGDIRAVRAIRNQGALWYRVPEPGWSEMEYMIRDWVNWGWLSGDIIVEQHIHHLDAIYWVLGRPPINAVGMGRTHGAKPAIVRLTSTPTTSSMMAHTCRARSGS